MSKISQAHVPSKTRGRFPLFSFFRPHPRVPYSGLLLNPKTGELVEPARRVKQSFVAECDINNIMKQYSATGQIAHINSRAQQGQYRDLPDDVDFQSALNTVLEGEKAFASLPSKTRDRFGNDPAQFLMFMADPSNAEEATKMGLVTARPAVAPTAAPAPNPASPPPEASDGSKGASKGQ